MMKRAYNDGIRAASTRFGVREASISEWLAGMALPLATRAGLNVMAPKLMPTIERGFEVPFRGLQSAAKAVRPPTTPADVLMRALAGAPASGGLPAPAAMIARGSK